MALGLSALAALSGVGGFVAWRMQGRAGPTAETAALSAPAPDVQSGVAAPAAAAPIAIADGTTLHVPAGSLVDFETGRVSADAGAGYDFEITFNTVYKLKGRGAARIQGNGSQIAPNRRQCDEVEAGEWFNTVRFPSPNSPKFKCFVTADGRHGYIEHLNGYDDPATGVDFAVTFFR